MAFVAPLEPFQGEDRTGAITQQPLEATAVAVPDQNRGIDRETPGVRPLQHVLDHIGGQDAAALEQAQHTPASPLLDFSNCLRAKCARVEAYALLLGKKQPVRDAAMVVQV